ncbi:MAG: 50S ribosomal protein L32 [Nocardioides sp.]|uniref:50S ribosomal protein L32 n=1 Tax=Nocardioides sp. TaxID=35761 RepID=UPI00261014B9|nr:50S ribosomal protein L32 [Nocardioides sp.]
MAVPKRRTSRSNTRHRRSQWKASGTHLVPVEVEGETCLAPRRLVRAVERGYVEPWRAAR